MDDMISFYYLHMYDNMKLSNLSPHHYVVHKSKVTLSDITF